MSRAFAVAVAVIEPFGRAFVAAGADQTFDIGFHQDLQHRLRYGSQEIAIALFCSSSTSAILSSVIGSSVGCG